MCLRPFCPELPLPVASRRLRASEQCSISRAISPTYATLRRKAGRLHSPGMVRVPDRQHAYAPDVGRPIIIRTVRALRGAAARCVTLGYPPPPIRSTLPFALRTRKLCFLAGRFSGARRHVDNPPGIEIVRFSMCAVCSSARCGCLMRVLLMHKCASLYEISCLPPVVSRGSTAFLCRTCGTTHAPDCLRRLCAAGMTTARIGAARLTCMYAFPLYTLH